MAILDAVVAVAENGTSIIVLEKRGLDGNSDSAFAIGIFLIPVAIIVLFYKCTAHLKPIIYS